MSAISVHVLTVDCDGEALAFLMRSKSAGENLRILPMVTSICFLVDASFDDIYWSTRFRRYSTFANPSCALDSAGAPSLPTRDLLLAGVSDAEDESTECRVTVGVVKPCEAA